MFDISWGLVIWTMITFTILMVIMSKWAFPMILGAIQDRENHINDSISNAEKANLDAQDNLKATEDRIAGAQKEINEMLSAARTRAEDIVAKGKEDGDAVKVQKLEEAVREIERSKQNAINELRREVAGLVIMATEMLIDEKLDKEKHQNLIDSYISNLKMN
jgi:F-type H+-transporting ATPase subunit b